eukprot:101645-Pelagomonas_calceolata.AAC.2
MATEIFEVQSGTQIINSFMECATLVWGGAYSVQLVQCHCVSFQLSEDKRPLPIATALFAKHSPLPQTP